VAAVFNEIRVAAVLNEAKAAAVDSTALQIDVRVPIPTPILMPSN